VEFATERDDKVAQDERSPTKCTGRTSWDKAWDTRKHKKVALV